jgi:hypothetical protein
MKKKLFYLLMIFPLIIGACSCNKFDLNTYKSAVDNYQKSTGFEYELTITTKVDGQDYYMMEESKNKYLLTTSGTVYDFASELKSYKIMTPENGPQSAPNLIYTLNRYYSGDENTFYTNEISNIDKKHKELNKSYEEKYNDVNSPYNTKNLVPIFEKKQLTGFKISDIESQKGYSTSMFTAAVPAFADSDDDITLYSVTMDDNFYFSTIEYSFSKVIKITVDGEEVETLKTTTYKYKFLNYNSDVEIVFPADLAGY